jgi:putative DNA primase/helicase
LSALLGDYAVTIDPGLLMASSQGKNEAARSIARLPGARLALMNETPTHALWDDGAVKALASREAIQARELYREAFDFFPTHKLWIRGNHLPGARDASDGFWRRMVAVKFGEQIGAGEIISNLDRQIIDEELSGVLAWALKGCRDWQASGLKIPASVAKEIDAYRAESDTLGQWLEEETERAPDGRLPAKAAFASYSLFCAEHGLKPGSETAFGRAMAERGLTKYRAMRERGYEGLRLRDATGAFEGGEDAT